MSTTIMMQKPDETPSAVALADLVNQARRTLARADTAAEVLDARDEASLAYDAAKRAARLVEAKGAADDALAAVRRLQADALEIDTAARRRLADEYDAAQARGEVHGHGGARNSKVATPDLEKPTIKQLGLTKQQIEQDRTLRDAEARAPGVTKRAVEAMLDARREPTRAGLKRAIAAVVIYGASAADAAERAASPPRRSEPKWEEARTPQRLQQLVKELAGYDPDEVAGWLMSKSQLASAHRHARKVVVLLQRLQESSDAD
jgi:hypothetical protein